MEAKGQYGKRNPLFMYQTTAGYSISAPIACGKSEEAAHATKAEPPQSGPNRCGALQE